MAYKKNAQNQQSTDRSITVLTLQGSQVQSLPRPPSEAPEKTKKSTTVYADQQPGQQGQLVVNWVVNMPKSISESEFRRIVDEVADRAPEATYNDMGCTADGWRSACREIIKTLDSLSAAIEVAETAE